MVKFRTPADAGKETPFLDAHAADGEVEATPVASSPVVAGRAGRLRYRVFGRVLPSALYAYLGVLVGVNLKRSILASRDHGAVYVIGHPVRLGLYLLFCTIPIALFLTRPVPRARDGTLVARGAAFAGTVILIGAGAVRGGAGQVIVTPPSWFADGAALLLALFTALEVYTLLRLRTSFSIIPEARRLVTDGPYAVVRNPLYAAEIAAAVAWAASEPRLLLVAAVPLFVALQLLRIRFEERLLRRAFPHAYRDYFARTPRLVPFLW